MKTLGIVKDSLGGGGGFGFFKPFTSFCIRRKGYEAKLPFRFFSYLFLYLGNAIEHVQTGINHNDGHEGGNIGFSQIARPPFSRAIYDRTRW